MVQHVWGFWTPFIANMPQMMAILMAIHAFVQLVKNKALQIVMDNMNAMANINHMGGP